MVTTIHSELVDEIWVIIRGGTMSLKMCTLLAVVLSVVWKVNCEQRCPPASMVSPCQCHSNSSMTLVTCNEISAPEELKVFTERIPKWNLDLLQFTDCVMMYIPSAILKGARIKYLEIADSRFQALFDAIPTQVNLEKLVLKNVNIIQGHDWNMFSKTRLTTLHISDVSLPVIDDKFKQIYSEELVELRLVNTKTKKVLKQAFSGLKRLRYFALTNSLLKNITKDVFPSPWYNIRSIDLSSNKFESLPIGLFDDMSNLSNVVLENNLITTIPQELMASGFQRRLYYHLKGNQIFCDCSMKWMGEPESRRILISGECHGPPELKGKSINTLGRADFAYCG